VSRIDDYEPDDTAGFLASCAFDANIRRAVAGKKGQKFLRELEVVLVSLPQKRLALGAMAESKENYEGYPPTRSPIPTGEVCALGAVAVARAVAAGRDHAAILKGLAKDFSPDRPGWELTKAAGEHLGICHPLAYEVVYHNDECGAKTPEERYEKVLAWVRSHITDEKTGAKE
jgi:hypothetical protein